MGHLYLKKREGEGENTLSKKKQKYLWRIQFDVWQNQYNIVKFKNKIKQKNTWR